MKRMKKFLALLLAVCMAMALAGCGGDGQSESGGTDADGEEESGATSNIDHDRQIVYGGASMIVNFNVKYITSANDIAAADQVYDTLIRKINGEFVGYLAKDWEISEDELDYTFYLQEDATFSNGDPITAEDVKFSYEFIRDECSQWAWVHEDLDNVEVVDEHTVVLHYTTPDASRLSNLCSIQYGGVFSKAAYEEYGEDYGTSVDTIVSSGPYVVTDWEESVSVTMEARDDYYGDEVDLKHLQYVAIADMNAAVVALQTGELDLYFNPLTGVALDTVRAADNVTVTEALTCRNESIYMNCSTGIFTDVRMRQAVAYAINKEEALEVCGSGLGEVVIYPCDLGDRVTANPDFVPSITYEYDVEKAKALVEECGNTGATVTIKSYNTEPYATMSVWLQGVLTAIGLDAQVETMERSAFLEQLAQNEVEICPFSWSNTSFDFGSAVGVYMNSSNAPTSGNYSQYNNPVADELVRLGNSTSDVEVRKEYYRQLIELFMEDVPAVAMYAMINAIGHSDQLVMEDAGLYQMALVHWAE